MGPEIGTNWTVKCQRCSCLPKWQVRFGVTYDVNNFSHKCPFVYMSRRVPSLDVGINLEICEHFNSYIQKISTAQDL